MKYLKQYATEAAFTADTKEDVQVSHIIETGRVDYNRMDEPAEIISNFSLKTSGDCGILEVYVRKTKDDEMIPATEEELNAYGLKYTSQEGPNWWTILSGTISNKYLYTIYIQADQGEFANFDRVQLSGPIVNSPYHDEFILNLTMDNPEADVTGDIHATYVTGG